MTDCEHCGREVAWKNAAGHYRDVCEDCAQSVAGDRLPHYSSRERADCIVCKAYRREHAIPIDV